MFREFQLQLAAWFVCLSLVLFAVSGVLAIFVFDSSLTYSLDEEVQALISELKPAVKLGDPDSGGKPTLAAWAGNMEEESRNLAQSIQLYDPAGHLLERYGQTGIYQLASGALKQSEPKARISVRSLNSPVRASGKVVGYLQVQVSTRQRDKAVHEFAATTLMVAPFLAIGLGLSSYFLSAKAVVPLERTMEMLRRFVADAGHELKTPIAVIEASVQTLEESLKAHNMPTDVTEIMSRASQRMKELSQKLVLLARLENPELGTVAKEKIKIDDAIEPVLAEFRGLTSNKKIDFSCPTVPAVALWADAEAMRTLVSNLLENALRYTESGGRISFSVEQRDRQLLIKVCDSGIGIPKEHLPFIFERFYRVDKSRSRGAGGSGLGLSIVKAIVDTHNGSIVADSVESEGSTFTVVLPC